MSLTFLSTIFWTYDHHSFESFILEKIAEDSALYAEDARCLGYLSDASYEGVIACAPDIEVEFALFLQFVNERLQEEGEQINPKRITLLSALQGLYQSADSEEPWCTA